MVNRTQSAGSALEGARKLLTTCLALAPGEKCAIVSDEAHEPEIQLVQQAAAETGIQLNPVRIPLSQQLLLLSPDVLPLDLCDSLTICEGLIVLTQYSESTTSFRMALLDYYNGSTPKGRAASMPGVLTKHFPFLDVDYAELDRDCESLGAILLRSRRLRILTMESDGTPHWLKVNINESTPTPSSGLVAMGDWDNAPAGETFVLPRRYSASGSFVLDGSYPGNPVPHGEEIVLHLKRGAVTDIPANGIPLVTREVRDLFYADYATRTPKSRNACTLCEVGFGANPLIQQFFGLPVFDEKSRGSLHVAFGRNKQLGGTIKGVSHHDLVISRPTVYVDASEAALLQSGVLDLTESLVWPSWRSRAGERDLKRPVRLTGRVCHADSEGRLKMHWHTPAGVQKATQVGDDETSKIAAAVHHVLSAAKRPLHPDRIAKATCEVAPTDAATLATIRLLASYGITENAPLRRARRRT